MAKFRPLLFLFLVLLHKTVGEIDLDMLDDDDYWESIDVDIGDYDIDEDDEEDMFDDDESMEVGGEFKAFVNNPSSYKVDLYFQVDSTSPVQFFFSLGAGVEQRINTFPGQTFYVALHKTQTLIHTWRMDPNKSKYLVKDNVDEFDGEEWDGIPVDKVLKNKEDDEVAPGEQFSLSVENYYPFPVDVYWIDPSGEDHFIVNLAETSHKLNTFLGHNFALKDEQGNLLQKFTAKSRKTVIFGEEYRTEGEESTVPSQTPTPGQIYDDDDLELDDYFGDDEDEYQFDDVDDEDEEMDLEDEEILIEDLEFDDLEECDADGTCDSGYRPTHTAIEPLLSKWSNTQNNPYIDASHFVAKFRNLGAKKVTLVRGGVTVGTLRPGGSSTVFVSPADKIEWKDKEKKLKTSVITNDRVFYVLEGKNKEWNKLHLAELQYAKSHYKETGRIWLVRKDQPKPTVKFWPAKQKKQRNRFSSFRSKMFKCPPQKQNDDSCYEKTKRIKLTVLYPSPRILQVESFLSEEEAIFLMMQKKTKVQKGDSRVFDEIINRFGDLHRKAANQIEYEFILQKYESDELVPPQLAFDVKDCKNIRTATLMLFLNDITTTGHLVFHNTDVEVLPKRGEGILFYNQLTDGNVDGLLGFSFKERSTALHVAYIHLWEPIQGCKRTDPTAVFTTDN